MPLQRRMRIMDGSTETPGEVTSLKVAFATTDMQHVDQHFGSAQSFAMYAVNVDEATMLEAVQFGELAQDGNEDKLMVKLQALQSCAAVYCQAVGSSAVRQLLAYGIQPVKVSEGRAIVELIGELQAELRAGPSAWLAQAIRRQQQPDENRFDDMEAEGWDE